MVRTADFSIDAGHAAPPAWGRAVEVRILAPTETRGTLIRFRPLHTTEPPTYTAFPYHVSLLSFCSAVSSAMLASPVKVVSLGSHGYLFYESKEEK